MKYSQSLTLKNGKPCLIRSCEAADARAVLENFRLTHGETDFLLTYPDEKGFTEEQERAFLLKKEKSGNEVELCAVVEGKLVGTAGIDAVGAKEKVRHRADFGISIEKSHWGQGIGRALTAACIDCARQAGYEQLELTVVADNTSAVALYQKLGFSEYGRNPKGFRSRTAGWQTLVLMRLELR